MRAEAETAAVVERDAMAAGFVEKHAFEQFVFGPVAENKGQALIEAASAVVDGQATLLRQAVGNLVENAIKFSPEGAAVAVRLEPGAARVRLIVEDNGPGIPESDRAAALKPYERLGREGDGKGLGLALVAACAKLHKGRLTLESASPGLRAVLDLPLRPVLP